LCRGEAFGQQFIGKTYGFLRRMLTLVPTLRTAEESFEESYRFANALPLISWEGISTFSLDNQAITRLTAWWQLLSASST
jgi:hypothetical protein